MTHLCFIGGTNFVRYVTPKGVKDVTTAQARAIAEVSGTQEQLGTALRNQGEWISVPDFTPARGIRPRNFGKFAIA